MASGLLGKKIGMTQIFDTEGNIVPVTVVETGPCVVLEVLAAPARKIKLGFEPIKETRLTKPESGFFKKIGVSPLRYIREFGLKDTQEYKIGQEIKADLFKAGDFVDVSAVSIGKGFQGGMKRWNWSGGPGTHGSMHHRRVGSIGSSADPSRTFRGRHMPGHMGSQKVTVQGLRVMLVDVENNLILLKGGVPGARKSLLNITLSKKRAFKSLEEKKATHIVKRNPMKQSKAKAKGKT